MYMTYEYQHNIDNNSMFFSHKLQIHYPTYDEK